MKQRLVQLQAWYRRLPPVLVDALLAALVLAEGTLETLATGASGPAKVQATAIISLIAIAVVLRRRFALASIAVATAAVVLVGLIEKEATDTPGGPFLAYMLLLFWFGLRTEGRQVAAGAVLVAAGAALAIGTDQYDDSLADLAFVGLFLATIGVGQMLRSRGALNRALRERATQADAERERSAATAVAEERVRVAGELHDVVAHALGAMTVQASAARRLAERDDAAGARGAFVAVEETGRDALGELRRLLGVLRRDDEDIALAPQPQLAFLPDLVRRVRAAGLPVELSVQGTRPPGLPAGVDLTGYRLVQAALGAALNGGDAGSARVMVRYGEDHVEIEVADDGRAEARELPGMRERVRVYGGELRSVPLRPRGHRLHSRLPLGSVT